MSPAHQELWTRLEAHGLDQSGDALSFLARLARDNRWTHAFARRAILEYKRFAFLAVAAGHPVTPSDQVDQVWHLHLLYTRDYWEEFCPRVLGMPLHHGPTRGGAAESAKFHEWYAHTVASYREHFGAEPPADLWPAARERFGRDVHFARVNTRKHWIIPRILMLAAPLSALRRVAFGWLAVTVGWLAFVPGARAAGTMPLPVPVATWNPLDFRGTEFLALYVWLLIGACLAAGVWKLSRPWFWDRQLERSTPPGHEAGPTLQPDEIGLLAGGEERALQAALAALVKRGALKVEADGSLTTTTIPPGQATRNSPVEDAVLGAVTQQGLTWRLPSDRAVERELRLAHHRLEGLGLMFPDAWRATAGWQARLITALPLSLGVAKIAVGIVRGRPVGFLVGLCVLNGLAMLLIGRPGARVTRRGERLLARWREQHAPLRQASAHLTTQSLSGAEAAAMLALGVGLFGVSALADDAMFTPLHGTLFSRPDITVSSWSGSDGGSSSDGGGGDGGGGDSGGSDGSGSGCGGCGGCGGGGD